MPIDVVTIPPDGSDGTFPDTAIGTVVWPKSLGRPNKPRLADGLSILIQGTDVVSTAPGGPVHEIGLVLEPRVEDVDGDADHWRVNFFQGNLKSVERLTEVAIGPLDQAKKAQIERQATYRVTVALRPGVSWSGPRPLHVHPHERSFLKHEGLVELPDFKLTAG